jgi:electron transfer flavoprotein beta subunit
MKLLVCVSKTPDTTSKIAFTDGNTTFDTNGIQYIMNPYDEWYALVRAIELKEQVGAGSVTTIMVGDSSADVVIRKGLAIGEQNFDIIFLGKETIDYNGGEIGAMVAELMDLPFISFGSKMEVAGNTATINREIEGGSEILEVDTPFVISAAKGLAEQRIPNMRGIMMAKRKPLNVIPPVEVKDLATVSSYELPDEKTAVKMIDPENMEELVRLLHEEAKVI